MSLCPACLLSGYCRRFNVRIVSDMELDNPEFIRDVRRAALEQGKTCDEWLEHMTNLYRDYPGRIVDSGGAEVWLDMSDFERSKIRYWFRDFCCTPCPTDVSPRVRREARERVRVLATILRAADPVAAQLWGVRAANDNEVRR